MTRHYQKLYFVSHLTTKKYGASGNGSKKSPDQSVTDFKMIFNHQNLGIDTSYVEISVILVKQ